MRNIEIRKPTARDVRLLVENMRQTDKDELKAYYNDDYTFAVNTSIKFSTDSWAVVVNGKLLFIAGVGLLSMIGKVGCPWLLGTDAINQFPFEFYKQSKKLLNEVLRDYAALTNHVYGKNATAIRFLKHLGFSVKEAEPYGAHGELFHPFTMER